MKHLLRTRPFLKQSKSKESERQPRRIILPGHTWCYQLLTRRSAKGCYFSQQWFRFLRNHFLDDEEDEEDKMIRWVMGCPSLF